MKHRIDPKVDCVFKALLGSETNRDLLIHFLNAMLGAELAEPISEVQILNPYNEREFLDDKLSIVDVKARDAQGHEFQVEIQLTAYHHLRARMLYTWADLYSQQLASGQNYSELKPTYSIWLLAENLICDDTYAHQYKLRDANDRVLLGHGGIWILELAKFDVESIVTDLQRWLMFFKKGEQLDDEKLPEWMNTNEMRKAMSTLKQFSEKERDYHAYQARLNFQREQSTIQWELEQMEQERQWADQARQQADQARQRADQARQRADQARQQAEQERQRAEQERQQAEQERQRAEQERQRAEQERQRAEQELERERLEKLKALQEKEAALAEIARLKASLGKQ